MPGQKFRLRFVQCEQQSEMRERDSLCVCAHCCIVPATNYVKKHNLQPREPVTLIVILWRG